MFFGALAPSRILTRHMHDLGTCVRGCMRGSHTYIHSHTSPPHNLQPQILTKYVPNIFQVRVTPASVEQAMRKSMKALQVGERASGSRPAAIFQFPEQLVVHHNACPQDTIIFMHQLILPHHR